ncbi:amidohydrolase [Polynucleobacter sp. MWH-Loch1C5]|uniref:M20 aminoacylase family protein n=1 Tax=Polynucleobacter sp. MWH-Loch1C5 TaxID=2689108 RepID=UPI001C0BC396|nr:M20 aminoacylase family protein [Polynucleobacter sp. MWH-Loch1C5]MBU3541949.1 amidohydrolase [Polynucleobacter sp. MWH-Loch1C5]
MTLLDIDLTEFVEIRRQLHANPELAFEETTTAKFVAEKLNEWGYTVTTGIGGTGVVGQLKIGNGSKAIGIRADMDALPITEATSLPWASKNIGKMHACGHDGHTASLLAAAKIIAERKKFNGTVNLIFQPAEEGAGGAKAMIADGLFEKFPCDAIFAFHNMPGISQGKIVTRPGPMMASSDYLTVRLTGIGGHGGFPHKATDVVVAGSSIVMALQTIVSRNIDPLNTSVITVGAFNSGYANNVIPSEALLEISIRALDSESRTILKDRIFKIIKAQADSFNVLAELDWRDGYTVLVNSESETRFLLAVAEKVVGQSHVDAQGQQLTGSEDFAFMLEKIPGCYFLIGNGSASEPMGACMVHNPGYDFNDKNIDVAAHVWHELVSEYLA